jgi:hypothetical protein
MSRNTWPEDDRIEYEQLVDEALMEEVVSDRREVFLAGLDDAVQAQRIWAQDIQATIRNDGADKILRKEQDRRRPRVAVSHGGEVLGTAPREFGRKNRDGGGKVVHTRGLFDFEPWDALRQKRAEFAQMEHAAAVDKLTVDKLLSLERMAPGSANPAEACERIGVSVEEFLRDEAV